MPTFISIGGYTFNLDEVLFYEDFMVDVPGQAAEAGVRVEFRRKGVIFLRGIDRKVLDDIIQAK